MLEQGISRSEKTLPKYSLAAHDRAGRNEARGRGILTRCEPIELEANHGQRFLDRFHAVRGASCFEGFYAPDPGGTYTNTTKACDPSTRVKISR